MEGTAPGDDETPPVTEALFNASEDHFLANLLLSTGYEIGPVSPYFLVGIGVTTIDPKAGLTGITHYSWSLGFGIEADFKGRFGLRAQGKFVPTYVNVTDEILQEWTGAAIATANRSTMTQWELQAGLFVRF
jgi:hypothetical protein